MTGPEDYKLYKHQEIQGGTLLSPFALGQTNHQSKYSSDEFNESCRRCQMCTGPQKAEVP